MFVRSIVAALAALSTPIHSYAVHRRGADLEVQLNSIENTVVEAVLTNNGDRDVAVLNRNTILDTAPVKRASVYRDGAQVQFDGIAPLYLMSQLGQDAFTVIPAGESVKNRFDLAEIHDLTDGGEYTVSSRGTLPLAHPKGTGIEGAIPYQSNELKINVDGVAASAVSKAINFAAIKKRTTIDSSCSGNKLSGLQTALDNAAQLATAAAEVVSSDTAKIEEYFSTTDAGIQQTVAERLQAGAQEASSTPGGGTTYHCDDPLGACSQGVLAWTLPSQNIVNNCDLYYSALPPLSNECHGQDQATTSLHEFMHASAVVSPPTEDYAYGYEQSTSLPTDQAVQNADNYALLALSVYLNC